MGITVAWPETGELDPKGLEYHLRICSQGQLGDEEGKLWGLPLREWLPKGYRPLI